MLLRAPFTIINNNKTQKFQGKLKPKINSLKISPDIKRIAVRVLLWCARWDLNPKKTISKLKVWCLNQTRLLAHKEGLSPSDYLLINIYDILSIFVPNFCQCPSVPLVNLNPKNLFQILLKSLKCLQSSSFVLHTCSARCHNSTNFLIESISRRTLSYTYVPLIQLKYIIKHNRIEKMSNLHAFKNQSINILITSVNSRLHNPIFLINKVLHNKSFLFSLVYVYIILKFSKTFKLFLLVGGERFELSKLRF